MKKEKVKMEYLDISSVPMSIKDANCVEINRIYNQSTADINDYINYRTRGKDTGDLMLPMYKDRKIDVFIEKMK